MEEEHKVKPKPRKSRRKCYGGDDPGHICSVNHVRVPAHCRLKRFRKKKKERELAQSLDNVSSVSKDSEERPSAIAEKWRQDAAFKRVMQQL